MSRTKYALARPTTNRPNPIIARITPPSPSPSPSPRLRRKLIKERAESSDGIRARPARRSPRRYLARSLARASKRPLRIINRALSLLCATRRRTTGPCGRRSGSGGVGVGGGYRQRVRKIQSGRGRSERTDSPRRALSRSFASGQLWPPPPSR